MSRSTVRQTAVVLTILFFASMQVAVTQSTYAFADLVWGSSSNVVRSTLVSRGYTFARELDDGALRFDGTILSRPTWVYAEFTPQNQLVKLSVFLLHDSISRTQRFFAAERTMIGLKETIEARYGPAESNYSYFLSPYYRGDGYETQAVELGKASFVSFWPAAADGSHLWIEIDEDVDVAVHYEGPGWSAELQRRRSRQLGDF